MTTATRGHSLLWLLPLAGLLACSSGGAGGPQGGAGGATSATGGTTGSGGTGAVGGVAGTSGGAAGTGGAAATAGAGGTGGATSPTGGAGGTGGATATAGAGGTGGTTSPTGGTGGAAGSQGTGGGARGGSAGGTGGTGGTAQAGGSGGTNATGGTGGTGTGGVTESIHYYGRWNKLSDRAITVNSGSHVSAQFSGTAISARFDVSVNLASDLPTLAWQVDQGTWQEAEVASTVVLGQGLAAGSHSVTLMARALDENQNRWSPPLTSSITFLGFDVTGGAVQPSPRPLRPKLEFLGDSITEGVVIWKSYNGKSTQCWRNDGRIAYPTQTAQKLGAEWRQVGFGYQGLLRVGDGGVPRANDSFNWIYKDVPRDSWQADVVVINEGTNDSSASVATFRSAYATYLATIRAAYPNAKIVAMRPFSGAQADPIKAEVDARAAAGDRRTYYVDTTGWLASSDLDGLHPNAQGSAKAAAALSAAITAIGLP